MMLLCVTPPRAAAFSPAWAPGRGSSPLHRGSLPVCGEEQRADPRQPGRRTHFQGLPVRPRALGDGAALVPPRGPRSPPWTRSPGPPRGPRSPLRTVQPWCLSVDPKPLANKHPCLPGAFACAPSVGNHIPTPRGAEALHPALAPPQPGPSLPGPQLAPPLARLQARTVGVCSARAPHTHHPGLRRLTHVSRRRLKEPRSTVLKAAHRKAPATLRGGASFRPIPWTRPQPLYVPYTSPPHPAAPPAYAMTKARRA